MTIYVRVKPGSKQSQVLQVDENHYVVLVDAPAKDNKANLRLISLLAEHFKVPKTGVVFVSGVRSRDKVLTINR